MRYMYICYDALTHSLPVLQGGTDFSNNPASGFSQISPNSSSPGKSSSLLGNTFNPTQIFVLNCRIFIDDLQNLKNLR